MRRTRAMTTADGRTDAHELLRSLYAIPFTVMRREEGTAIISPCRRELVTLPPQMAGWIVNYRSTRGGLQVAMGAMARHAARLSLVLEACLVYQNSAQRTPSESPATPPQHFRALPLRACLIRGRSLRRSDRRTADVGAHAQVTSSISVLTRRQKHGCVLTQCRHTQRVRMLLSWPDLAGEELALYVCTAVPDSRIFGCHLRASICMPMHGDLWAAAPAWLCWLIR